MRQTISALVAAIAVVAASAAPAMACGWASPCAQTYVPAYTYGGCNTGCGAWGYERLPDPVQQYQAAPVAQPQYYYVDQGPTYTGPGNFAPYPAYREGGVRAWDSYRPHRRFRAHHGYRYGYYAPRHYGYREHVLRRYY
ncbi:MAG TPA: hypothetical protein VFE56_00215 [Candidatus Binataceae bacterium]|jgi:hypothetical protein|nr:hypothetical protein [Candidatus Binataceae bacterium]